MPDVNAVQGEAVLVQVGDGAAIEIFAHPCLINAERSLELSAEASSTPIPDCTEVSKPAGTRRQVTAVDWQISGSGLLHVGDDKAYADWLLSGARKNVKAKVNKPGGLTLTGPAVLTAFSVTGTRGEYAQCSITIQGADRPTSTAS